VIELPIGRQVPFDFGGQAPVSFLMVGRVDHAEVSAQVAAIDGPGDPPCPTLAIVPLAKEGAVAAALATFALGPGAKEGNVGDVFARYEGFAVFLPLDRRIVSVRVPFPASVFVYDSTASLLASGLVWMRELARPCGCR